MKLYQFYKDHQVAIVGALIVVVEHWLDAQPIFG